MELISKDTAIRVVDSGRNRQQLVDMMRAVPPVNAIEIPEGATNGDMIKAMFPFIEVEKVTNKYSDTCIEYEVHFTSPNGNNKFIVFKESWWNAPYKESEG